MEQINILPLKVKLGVNMAKNLFDFEAEFRLGIEAVDNEHARLIDMLNAVHNLISIGEKENARYFFTETLSDYVDEHFANEEKFMESFEYPQIDDHKKIHENFKKSYYELKPAIETFDETAFRRALTDVFTWILTHIGKTDRRYARYYFETQKE
ncbi:MAG: hypothetical protein CVU39_08890 [Chloroflexi bacterium HGW-Chloroflexi-10]|nr:MAG: hypothetical protein CVU39_08890 [Chloroflexi bacterium HGW-Chloroflexi-10]